MLMNKCVHFQGDALKVILVFNLCCNDQDYGMTLVLK